MIKNIPKRVFLVLVVAFIVITGCKHKPVIATKLTEHYKNDVYKDYDTAAFHAEFIKQFDLLKPKLHYAGAIENYYTNNNFEPRLVQNFLTDGQLRKLVQYLNHANEHGINPEIFKGADIAALLDTIQANRFKTITEVYPVLAKLELQAANALISYSSVLQFGVINPHRLYRRYETAPQRPDSTSFKKALDTDNLMAYLDQVQPKSIAYLQLKKALADVNMDVVDSPKLFRIKTIKLNMERLRWQIPAKEDSYIFVNIPAFNLEWVQNGKAMLNMRVCVGEPRPLDYDDRLKHFLETHNIDDKPQNHQTPVLTSHINTIQLNPTWRIPSSIAQNEIYYAAQKNPDYFDNNNIRVYYHDIEIKRPDTITWAHIKREHIPYTFKQDASDLNALGKFKFIFDNDNSVYLHDTPNKKAFLGDWRAVSHGCVRVQDPMMLARLLVGDTTKMDNIRMEVGLAPMDTTKKARYAKLLAKRAAPGFELQSKFLTLDKQVQLFIDYYTCLPDASGKPVFYFDAYRMDADLEKAMGKYLSK
ncbi:L,D-transpeptidase family protein [Mucilaginibacter sp. HMF5004]|uniref:L,D-transpeptidase family protein n=1 Tax=Mucilaginibacter rivuli TaxID=2857527 RepID=UPI001C5DD6D0|nr:L,D-transpeptidase family protein [Mucilaginibacter rivuli]MBW4889926.1 L,D-transpeptidase family protein [Mucilaginibacter rivuli]